MAEQVRLLGGDYLAEDLHWNVYLVTVLNILLNGITEFLFQRFVVYARMWIRR